MQKSERARTIVELDAVTAVKNDESDREANSRYSDVEVDPEMR